MDKDQKQKIALFRFGVIAELVGRKDLRRGERENKIRELAGREWEIPGSGRTRVSRSVIREWLRRYEGSGRKIESLFPKDRCDSGRPRSIDPETELVLVNLKPIFYSKPLSQKAKWLCRKYFVPAFSKIVVPININISKISY